MRSLRSTYRSHALFALVAMLSGCAAQLGEHPGYDIEVSEEELLGRATYTDCTESQIRVFTEAHRRGRIASRSTAFATCVERTFTQRSTDPAFGDGLGPYRACGSSGSPTPARLRGIASSTKSLQIRCDPAAAGLWGYSGWQDGTTEAFTLGATATIDAGSTNPDLAEIASTYWHEVLHSYGYGHDDSTLTCPVGDDAVYLVDDCLDGTLRAAERLCGRYDASLCPNGLFLPTELGTNGLFSEVCECVVDSEPRPARPSAVLPAGGAAVARATDIAHVFTAVHGGRAAAITWSASPNRMWGDTRQTDEIDASTLPEGARITAVARTDASLDLFAADVSGRIVHSTWHESTQRFSAWAAITAADRVYPGAPIAVVARNPRQLDVFAVGTDWAIWTVWRNDGFAGGVWQPEFPITARDVALPGNEIAAVGRGADQLDVFYATIYGAVHSVWYNPLYNAGRWSPHPVVVLPDGSVPGNGRVAAVSRHPGAIDVAAAGMRGQIHNAFYADGRGWGRRLIAPEGTVVDGGPIAVFSRRRDHLDVYAVSRSGAVVSSWWNEHTGRPWSEVFAVIPSGVSSDAWLSSMSWHGEHVEVVAIERWSSTLAVPPVQRAYWDERTGWTSPQRWPVLRTPERTSARASSTSQIEMTWRDDEGSALRYQILGRRVGGPILVDSVLVDGLVPRGDHALRRALVTGLSARTDYSLRVCIANGTERTCSASIRVRTGG